MEQLQIKKLRRNQIKPINSVLAGHDTLVVAPTSYGKSLIYQIPAVINNKKLTVVIEPLLALIHDQVEKLQGLGISAAYLDSTQSNSQRERTMELLDDREITLLYIAPERLETGILTQIEKRKKIGLIVVDECHCVVSWGYDLNADKEAGLFRVNKQSGIVERICIDYRKISGLFYGCFHLSYCIVRAEFTKRTGIFC